MLSNTDARENRRYRYWHCREALWVPMKKDGGIGKQFGQSPWPTRHHLLHVRGGPVQENPGAHSSNREQLPPAPVVTEQSVPGPPNSTNTHVSPGPHVALGDSGRHPLVQKFAPGMGTPFDVAWAQMLDCPGQSATLPQNGLHAPPMQSCPRWHAAATAHG